MSSLKKFFVIAMLFIGIVMSGCVGNDATNAADNAADNTRGNATPVAPADTPVQKVTESVKPIGESTPIIVKAPTLSPKPDIYPIAPSIEANCETPDAKIYVTKDGSIPTEKSLVFSQPIVPAGNKITVSVIAVVTGSDGKKYSSSVVSGTYFVKSEGHSSVHSSSQGSVASASTSATPATTHAAQDTSTPTEIPATVFTQNLAESTSTSASTPALTPTPVATPVLTTGTDAQDSGICLVGVTVNSDSFDFRIKALGPISYAGKAGSPVSFSGTIKMWAELPGVGIITDVADPRKIEFIQGVAWYNNIAIKQALSDEQMQKVVCVLEADGKRSEWKVSQTGPDASYWAKQIIIKKIKVVGNDLQLDVEYPTGDSYVTDPVKVAMWYLDSSSEVIMGQYYLSGSKEGIITLHLNLEKVPGNEEKFNLMALDTSNMGEDFVTVMGTGGDFTYIRNDKDNHNLGF